MRPAIAEVPLAARLARFAPILGLSVIAAGLYASGVHRYVTPASLAAPESTLRAAIALHPVAAFAGLVGLYAVATASFVPLGIVLMLASGFLFGPWLGGLATIVGSTLGAVLTYLAARYALGNSARAWCESNRVMRGIVQGFDRDAFSYLLTLRLLPFSPFGLVNVAAAVAAAPLRAFVAATALGAIPTSLIYTHLGAGVGDAIVQGAEPGPEVLLQPRVFWPLVGLAVLSLLPPLLKRLRRPKNVSAG